MIQTPSAVRSNEQVTRDCWLMILECARIAEEAHPGQFINVKIGKAPLFRRPFSILRRVALPGGSMGIEILYRVVGEGTRTMTHLKRGDRLDVIGPSGNGFRIRQERNHILVAGGVGAAGLLMLAEALFTSAEKKDQEIYVLLGARSKGSLLLERDFASLGGSFFAATDDGSCGFEGPVTGLLLEVMRKFDLFSDTVVYACGPEPMYVRLSSICKEYGLPAQALMERRMMCGIGACLACVCKVDKEKTLRSRDIPSSHMQFVPEENFGYALVCRDGPVFDLEQVIFDD